MAIMLKVFGTVSILFGSFYLSVSIVQNIEKRKRELRWLYSIFIQLKSEIQYMGNTLPEIFEHIGSGAKEPFKQWLLKIANCLHEQEQSSFQQIWQEGIVWLLGHSALENSDLEPVFELQDKLGGEDVSVQLKAIDLVLLHIEQQRKGLEEEMEQKKKVITSFCFFIGALTLIFLL